MLEVVLGVDVGTSSLKAGLFTVTGKNLGLTRASYALSSPEPDAVEQDPDDWWRAFLDVTHQLLAAAGGSIHVAAVAIGGQAPTLCAVNANLRPTYPAISWLDQRPSAEAEAIYASLGQPVPVWGSWPAQAAWLRRHRPDALRETRWLLGCPEYVAAYLTGAPFAFLDWPSAEIAAAEIDLTMLPPLAQPGDVIGSLTSEAAAATGLSTDTRVVAGYVDGIMGVLGSGVRGIGEASLNGGTSGTYSVAAKPGLGYPVLGMYVAGAASNTSGKALEWFVQRVASPGCGYAEVLAGAAEVEPGAGGLVFLPHLSGERGPIRDPRSRGAWVGLTLDHDRRHLARSILEGVAFTFRAMRDSLASEGAPSNLVYAVGGQTRSELWNQIKADVLGVPVLVPEVIESSVVGAAIVGALGLGAYTERDAAVDAMVQIKQRHTPDPRRAELYDQLYVAYSQLYPAVRDINWHLHDVPSRALARGSNFSPTS